MAKSIQPSRSDYEEINALLFAAWQHGARHVVLTQEGHGTEFRFLGPDGTEQVEVLSLPYHETVDRLRKMSARFGRVHAHMGGNDWHIEPVDTHEGKRVFLHMRAGD